MIEPTSKIYFYELDTRESIFTRLQLNIAFYASFLTVISYMVRMIDYNSNFIELVVFYVFIFLSFCLLIKSAYLTYKSLTGISYRVLSDANDIYQYKKDVDKYVKEMELYNNTYGTNLKVPSAEKMVEDFLIELMTKCSSFNYKVNENRRLGIRRSLIFLVLASLPLIVSSSIFIGFDLDASSPRKELLIYNKELSSQVEKLDGKLSFYNDSKIHDLIKKEVINMCKDDKENKTPPPPPPPPEPIKPTWQVANESYTSPKPRTSKPDTKE
ncbi:hypothetical protein [Vibrio gazogenes]|uniref:Uncharacterized protein n=1 Tax=Vibrio gazogenes DSM 21264 = NBRC 103151 TaxID=1123492 RepID=A0A1M4VE96_VIBGA|nr:hypothetical protein [Vibrio gazogenes]USP15561.1 hypothetical protein MKS89_19410 [Vibrio gazogenes]SHE67173.1 hypothetical protein SAMN02745781_00694 [Vibrio gazogenes DSM 21264] [Vibrio gazogenes DSM 21264 = NBRC 103151]SJN57075.1 hypothetical protein BQ6471_02369 [Vibrio gazogenes]